MENNKNSLDNIEVLSPAGNAECFFADINVGADAVYLGLSNFNARMKADNFTTDNIKEFVDKAHLMGVKVYVTLNTLLTDDDFEELIELVKVLVDAKVDAYIIQDFGVAHLLKNSFDNINLHASTQLGIHNLYGAKVAEQLGFTRIVLSRETKLEDIKLIHENTNLEIEYFVQGALCVAFSGNCYLSSLEKQKSGNEGKCLQLCRLPYSNNKTNETAYYLSARDLSLLENIEELISAGVTSFKIEGRLKHPGYCGVTTQIYKEAINRLKLKNFSKSFIEDSYTNLRQTFSRGEFNKLAYLDIKTPDNIIYKDYQNHIGTQIGKVLSVKPFKNDLYKVTLDSKFPLCNGDGIKIIDSKTKSQVCSLGIGSINKINENKYEFVTKYNFSHNLSVYLTQNSSFENEVLSKKKTIDIDIKLFALVNGRLSAIICHNNQSFTYISEITLEKAKNSPLTKEDFFNQLNKLGDTNFKILNFEVDTNGVFLPKSILNQFRRELVSFVENQILNSYSHTLATFNELNYNNLRNEVFLNKLQPKNIAIIDENFTEYNLLENYDFIVFKPSNYSINTIEKYLKLFGEKFTLNLPTIANFNDISLIDKILKSLPEIKNLYANNIYGLYFTKNYNVITSPLLNTKNTYAIKSLLCKNIRTISSSIEASIEFANTNNLVFFKEGLFPLMTFAHCPFKTIYQNSCSNCRYSDGLTYSNPNLNTYTVKRFKIFNCYFELNTHFYQKNSIFLL